MSKLEEKVDAICKSLEQIERILLTVPKATARTRDSVGELRREVRSHFAEMRILLTHTKGK